MSSLDLIESIAELEDIVWAHSARVERLKLKLRLSGNKTLDEEYQNLVNSLNRSIQEGISPDRNHEEICTLEDERAEIINRLMRTEEGSHFEADSFEVSDIDVSDMHVIDMNAFDMNATEQDLTGKDATDVDATASDATDSDATDSDATDSDATDSDATDLDATDFSPPVSELPKNAARRRTVFTDLNYWETLKADLLSAERTLVVVCPYLTVRRTRAYTEIFEELVARNVAVRVITLPSGLLKEHMADQSALVMENLLDLGIEVITVPKIHQKIILVDEKVSWDGSLNWLSHKDTAEHINRSENLDKVAEIRESLNIYLKPTESDTDQSMMVTINRFSSDTESGSSIFVQQIVNASSEQLESILFDCDCDCERLSRSPL
ncbi:MAG: hypothetical protein EKK48_27010 [Candidatus Melainabacteria bacterium]|nr:MAG: hypothetical protein EKK48_27010 [Candidatus Melainabacteria bacterium]